MINDNTILSSFNDRPTLLEWLKKVEEALKSDTAKSISVDNPETNVYIIKITFADGRVMYTEPIRLPDSVKGVSILNNHLIITMQSGLTDDLGVINPYAETIVLNSETNTTEIGNNAVVDGNLQVNGNVLFGNSIISIQGTTKQNGILGTNADGKIAFKEISGGGSGDNFLYVEMNFSSTAGSNRFFNEAPLDNVVKAKILNGEIKVISGKYKHQNNYVGYFSVCYCGEKPMGPEDAKHFEGVAIFEDSSVFSVEKLSIDVTDSSNNLSLESYTFPLSVQ